MMLLRNLIVGVQILTYIVLGVVFWRSGGHLMAVAQMCYGIAAIFLFLGVSK